MRRKGVKAGVAAMAVGGMILLSTPPAEAVTVPNQWSCSRWTGRCVATNSHITGFPNVCYWTWWATYNNGISSRQAGC